MSVTPSPAPLYEPRAPWEGTNPRGDERVAVVAASLILTGGVVAFAILTANAIFLSVLVLAGAAIVLASVWKIIKLLPRGARLGSGQELIDEKAGARAAGLKVFPGGRMRGARGGRPIEVTIVEYVPRDAGSRGTASFVRVHTDVFCKRAIVRGERAYASDASGSSYELIAFRRRPLEPPAPPDPDRPLRFAVSTFSENRLRLTADIASTEALKKFLKLAAKVLPHDSEVDIDRVRSLLGRNAGPLSARDLAYLGGGMHAVVDAELRAAIVNAVIDAPAGIPADVLAGIRWEVLRELRRGLPSPPELELSVKLAAPDSAITPVGSASGTLPLGIESPRRELARTTLARLGWDAAVRVVRSALSDSYEHDDLIVFLADNAAGDAARSAEVLEIAFAALRAPGDHFWRVLQAVGDLAEPEHGARILDIYQERAQRAPATYAVTVWERVTMIRVLEKAGGTASLEIIDELEKRHTSWTELEAQEVRDAAVVARARIRARCAGGAV